MDWNNVPPSRMSLQLLEEITNHFSNDLKVGAGSYGSVYKGEHNGQTIAVKVLHYIPELDDDQFEMEYLNMASLKHKNVVSLVGYCHETLREIIEINGKTLFAEMNKRALCFQYMHNGSLEKYLSDEFHGQDWHTRYAIIKGICQGLKYLHEELQSPMYHLDLKPANVLLDVNMIPKLADFGMSRLFRGEQTQMTTSVIGTRGYMPPEYVDAGIISIKFDIFSLGVVMIKIMTGPTGYYRNDEMSSEEFIELVHANWTKRLHEESMYLRDSYSKQVKRCIEIALSCLEADRYKRPSIGLIINSLNETETLILSPEKDTGSSMYKGESVDIPLSVTDKRRKVHETTFPTIYKPENHTAILKEPLLKKIKIIQCTDDLGLVCTTDVQRKEPWTTFFKPTLNYRKSEDILCVILFIAIAVAVALFAFFLATFGIVRPVSITVEDASLTRFSLLATCPETALGYNLSLTLAVRNPNWAMNIANTAPLEATYSFLGQQFDRVQVSEKGAKYGAGKAVVHRVVTGSDSTYVAIRGSEYGKQRANGRFEVEVKLTGQVKYSLHYTKCHIEATCPLKLQVASSDSFVFQKVECKLAKPEMYCG